MHVGVVIYFLGYCSTSRVELCILVGVNDLVIGTVQRIVGVGDLVVEREESAILSRMKNPGMIRMKNSHPIMCSSQAVTHLDPIIMSSQGVDLNEHNFAIPC